MHSLVCFKGARPREELVAVRARVRLFPCVNLLMCFKAARLREELVAVRHNTFFWSYIPLNLNIVRPFEPVYS